MASGGKDKEQNGDREDQSLSPSNVTNNVDSQGDKNTIVCAGGNATLHVHFHLNMTVKNVVKKPFTRKAGPTRRRATKKVRSRGNRSTGNTSTVVVENNVAVVVEKETCNVGIPNTYMERPFPRTARLNTRKKILCRKLLDQLGRLSANGELDKCKESINRLLKCTRDQDYQATLLNARALNCIYGGNMESARKALHEVTELLDETENRIEHELGRDYHLSLIYLREDNCTEGIRLTEEALSKVEWLQAGCMAAWLVINHGWFYTKMAIQERNPRKQAELIRVAANAFNTAIHFSEQEYPDQLHDHKSRIRQFAMIGQVYLLLRCWRSVGGNCTRLGITDDISPDDLKEAQEKLLSLERGEPLCGICMVLYKLAKAHLCYRLQQYQEGLKEAEEARDFAVAKSFKQYGDFAESIVQFFKMVNVSYF